MLERLKPLVRLIIELTILFVGWSVVDYFVEDFNAYWMLGVTVIVFGGSALLFPKKY